MDWKKLYFWIEVHKQAEMLVKLIQDGYKRQGHFFRDVIEAYINEDPDFAVWMNKKRLEYGNVRTKKQLDRKQKLIIKAQQLEETLFSEQDLDNIFDLIEQNK